MRKLALPYPVKFCIIKCSISLPYSLQVLKGTALSSSCEAAENYFGKRGTCISALGLWVCLWGGRTDDGLVMRANFQSHDRNLWRAAQSRFSSLEGGVIDWRRALKLCRRQRLPYHRADAILLRSKTHPPAPTKVLVIIRERMVCSVLNGLSVLLLSLPLRKVHYALLNMCVNKKGNLS